MENYQCFVCKAFLNTVINLYSHLRCHESAGELTLPIRCRQAGCSSTFTTLWNFKWHLVAYHKINQASDHIATVPDTPDTTPVGASPNHAISQTPTVNKCLTSLKDVQQERIALVASLHANSAVPSNVVTQVISSINHMTECMVECIKSEVLDPLKSQSGASIDGASQAEQSLESLSRPLEFLSSRYKQDIYFQNHEHFVSPESIPIGFRCEMHGSKNRLVYDTY